MMLGTKIAIGLGALALGSLGVAIGVAAASPAHPAPAPGAPVSPPAPAPGLVLPPAPAGTRWAPATAQITSGTRVRVSVSQADLGQLARSVGAVADYNGWIDLLANPVVQGALQSSTLSAWGPAADGSGTMYPQPLPADWPTADANWSTEYHAEFVYGGSQPLVLSAFPIPIQAWVAK